jgi:hypothetical protein
MQDTQAIQIKQLHPANISPGVSMANGEIRLEALV